MNNSKKFIKKPLQVKKEKKQINPKIWVILSSVLSVILIAAILFDQLYKPPILTIEGDKYYLEDLRYYFYGVESNYDYINQLFGGSYWDMTYDEKTGATVRDLAKQEALDASLNGEILYREAKSNGYTLTDEEKEKISTDVKSLRSEQLSEAVIKKNGFTEEYLTNMLEKATLSNRYRDDKIKSFNLDYETIKADIDPEEYRQYDVEYFNISTQKKDENDESVAMSEEEKTSAYNKINAINETAQKTEDWSKLLPEDEKELSYKKDNFIASDTDFSDGFKEMTMAMSNGSISKIFEDENGYYLVRMINNNSTERYDTEVEDAISSAETDAFNKYFNDIVENYDYKLHKNSVRALVMGNITL